MTKEITVCFPEKQSLGSLYTAECQFPHQRKWIGEARGALSLNCPDDRMLGVALGSAGWEALAQTKANELSCLKSIDFSTSQFNERTFHPSVDLGELVEVRLDFLKIGDHELRLLRGLRSLRTVWLTGTSITDGGMREFQQFPVIANLVLKNTAITDQGLANMGDIPTLQILNLPAQITDSGLGYLKCCQSLRRLDLSFTKVTDEGLARLRDLPALSELYLNDTGITDGALQHLVPLKNLRLLFLSGTKISDAGLSALEQMTFLEHIELRDTQATEIGIARLRGRLPECAIFGP